MFKPFWEVKKQKKPSADSYDSRIDEKPITMQMKDRIKSPNVEIEGNKIYINTKKKEQTVILTNKDVRKFLNLDYRARHIDQRFNEFLKK